MTENNLVLSEARTMLGGTWRIQRYEHDRDGWPIQYVTPLDGLPPPVMAVAPGDYLSFFAGKMIERSRVHPIDKCEIARLAAILGVEASIDFEFRVGDIVVGFAMVIVHGFHSPRFFRELASALEKNPEAIKQRYRNDRFVMLLIERIEHDVEAALRAYPYRNRGDHFRLACRHLRDTMRAEIPRGGRKDNISALFFASVVRMARRLGADLRLPQHDDGRGGSATTPLLSFADGMRKLVVEQGRAIGVKPTDREFARLDKMTRIGLVLALERAKANTK